MATQKPGRLIMAGTSLGNQLDIPQRTLEAVRLADLLIVEEDRPARYVLRTAEIHRDYLKFTEHREVETMQALGRCLAEGNTAVYLSDQGMPVLADPGNCLLKIGYANRARIEVIPGPSSLTVAIAACPFDASQFFFAGFLPRQAGAREGALKRYARFQVPIVLMDTPYRRTALLKDCAKVFEKRQGMLAVDISGPSEHYYCESLGKLSAISQDLSKKLNFVLVISGR